MAPTLKELELRKRLLRSYLAQEERALQDAESAALRLRQARHGIRSAKAAIAVTEAALRERGEI